MSAVSPSRAGWKEPIWRPGIPLYRGFPGVSLGHAETRTAFPSSQLSPSLPRGSASSWARRSGAGRLDAFHLMEQAEAGQAGRTSTLLLVIPEELCAAQPVSSAPCRGQHSPSEGRQGLPALLKQNAAFNSHIFSFVRCGTVTRIGLLPNPPSHQLPQRWNALEVTLHFAVEP